VFFRVGEGQGREKDAKITIYKKTEDTYMLKLKTSREFYSKVRAQEFFLLLFFPHLLRLSFWYGNFGNLGNFGLC
jgi:hypothetical protein